MDYSEKHSLVGKKLGPYEVKSRLGSGGMGTVYLGFDAALDRHIALKTLAQAFITNQSWRARFHREAKAAARLRHPNVVQVYSVDLESVPPYIAMEFVEGMPLDALLREKGALTWQQALSICAQVAAALECAHEKGVIHRDIKPGNILVDGKGNAHVTDFGVAKLLEASTQLTSSGAMVGTPQYMSPEQFGVGEVGPHSDLFSLGTVTFEMLTGQLPFKADTPAALVKKITLEGPDTSLDNTPVPEPVKQLVNGLLQRETANRYATAKAVLQDLRQIRNQQALVHAPASPQIDLAKSVIDDLIAGTRESPSVHPVFSERRTSPWLWGAVGVLAIAVLGLMLLMARGPAPPSARQNTPQLGNGGGNAPPPRPGGDQGYRQNFQQQPRPPSGMPPPGVRPRPRDPGFRPRGGPPPPPSNRQQPPPQRPSVPQQSGGASGG